MLAVCGMGESSEMSDEGPEYADEDTDAESGGVGRVVVKSVVLISASVSKLTSGTGTAVDARPV